MEYHQPFWSERRPRGAASRLPMTTVQWRYLMETTVGADNFRVRCLKLLDDLGQCHRTAHLRG